MIQNAQEREVEDRESSMVLKLRSTMERDLFELDMEATTLVRMVANTTSSAELQAQLTQLQQKIQKALQWIYDKGVNVSKGELERNESKLGNMRTALRSWKEKNKDLLSAPKEIHKMASKVTNLSSLKGASDGENE